MFQSQLNKIKKHPPRDVSRLKALSYRSETLLPPSLATITLFCIVLLLIWGIISVYKDSRLSKHGIRTTASVTDNKVLHHGRHTQCSKISYQFHVNSGMSYSGNSRTLINDSDCYLRRGDSLDIVYLPEDPSINSSEHALGSASNLVMAWLNWLIVFLLIANWPLLRQILVLFRHRKLFRIGIWVDGTVLAIQQSRFGTDSRLSKLFPIKILVSYKTKPGESLETWVLSYQKWMLEKLKPGAKVNVCYHPNKANEALLLESYIL